MKTCQETAALLGDYVDGVLNPEDTATLKSHLAKCQPCAAFLHSYRTTGTATRLLLMKKVPTDFQARLKDYLKSHCGKR